MLDGSPDTSLRLVDRVVACEGKFRYCEGKFQYEEFIVTKKTIVLLSGGLDSATSLAVAKSEGYVCFALSFRYGQRHEFELKAAERVAKSQGVMEHRTISIDLGQIGGSALTDPTIDVPKNRRPSDMSDIPATYVPARNTIFLAYALAWAEVLGAKSIFIGVNSLDYSGYPDCCPEFIQAFQAMANLATKAAIEGQQVTIEAPLISMTKAQIIKKGKELGVDYSLTHSCYNPDDDGRSCGVCDSCQLRMRGFMEACVPDPTRSVSKTHV